MRDYGKVAPQFWTGHTGRQLRALGRDEQLIALYLLTCPSSNMLGLYYLPLPTLCHEIGSPFKGASKALRRVCETGFSAYDDDSEHVFVYRMAEFQIGASLEPGDNRVKWIKRELQSYRNTVFFEQFVERYLDAFHLHDQKGLGRPFEAPSKPGTGTGTGEGEGEETTSVRFSEDRFALFWKVHPYGSKKEAREAYRAVIKNGAPPDDEMLEILKNQIAERQRLEAAGEFSPRLPHLCRWFSKHRWEDSPINVRSSFLEGEDPF